MKLAEKINQEIYEYFTSNDEETVTVKENIKELMDKIEFIIWKAKCK